MTARKKKLHSKETSNTKVEPQLETTKKSFWKNSRLHSLLIMLLAFILYANTLGHDYTQDDAIVIYDNMFTQQGVQGIPGILQYDTFYGFFKTEGKSKLVSGGRYRPFTLIMFAIEWQIFERNPMIGHLVNIILYGLLGICIYLFLIRLLKSPPNGIEPAMLALITALLYIAHPIHTEAVANIKGRDEIMSMLGSILALWMMFKYVDTSKLKYAVYAALSFFVALMSKENAITFLAIAPVGFILFRKIKITDSLKKIWPILSAAIVFLLIRFSVLGFDFGGTPNELMNNPFLKLSGTAYIPFSFEEKFATIFFTLGKYMSLMFFPHPLSHDYYPRAIEIMSFSDWQVWLSIILYLAMIVFIFKYWKKDKLISFGLLFYLLSLSIVSNIVFPIGTNMSERFLFMPSLGILISLVYLAISRIKAMKMVIGLAALCIVAMGAKTIDRNKVWKDDFTLFTSDVKTNPRSAKLLNAAGGALTTKSASMAQGPERTQNLNQAIEYLNKAVSIHPGYRNAYLLLGNAHYYLENYEASVENFDKALAVDPNYADALKNLPIVLRDGGRYLGQVQNNFPKAEKWLVRSYNMSPQDYETCRLLGITYGIQGQNQKAIEYFLKAVELRPDIAANYSSLGTAYLNNGQTELAREAFNKAVELDPKALQHLKN